MGEDWFEVAYINFNEAILHGRAAGPIGPDRVRQEREVRVVLDEAQKQAIENMQSRHHQQMQRLLRGMAGGGDE